METNNTMGHGPSDYELRLKEAYDAVSGGTARLSDTQRLFNVYNEGMSPRETGHACPACVRRVLNRVRARLSGCGLIP